MKIVERALRMAAFYRAAGRSADAAREVWKAALELEREAWSALLDRVAAEETVREIAEPRRLTRMSRA